MPANTSCTISKQRADVLPCSFSTLTSVFAEYYSHDSQEEEIRIKKIPLKNYYKISSDRETMHCLICELDIDENNRFEHTVTLQHLCNAAFYSFVQKRFHNGDNNYIILNAKWSECRYCSGVRIPRHSEFESYLHARFDQRHIMLKNYCWSNIDLGSNPRTTETHARQVQNTFSEIVTMRRSCTSEARSTGLIRKQRNTITVPESYDTSKASSVITSHLVSTANDPNFNQQVRQEPPILSWFWIWKQFFS